MLPLFAARDLACPANSFRFAKCGRSKRRGIAFVSPSETRKENRASDFASSPDPLLPPPPHRGIRVMRGSFYLERIPKRRERRVVNHARNIRVEISPRVILPINPPITPLKSPSVRRYAKIIERERGGGRGRDSNC